VRIGRLDQNSEVVLTNQEFWRAPNNTSAPFGDMFYDLSAMLPRARHRLMHSREMPLFPYLPVIVWMGMIKVMLGATHDHDAQSMIDPTDLTMNRASIIPFPAPHAVAVIR
jgi:hypothetical protein